MNFTTKLDNVLTEKEICQVISHSNNGAVDWKLDESELKPAMEGMTGFLGDHFRAKIKIEIGDKMKTLHLFIKCVPLKNKPKAEFINEQKFFIRETLVFKLFEEMPDTEDCKRWCVKALYHSDSVIVMPDLAVEGYKTTPQKLPLDLPHVLVAAASLARFHAAYTNYETKKSANKPYNIMQDYGDYIVETIFKESDWLRAAAKLAANFLINFSEKYGDIPNLEANMVKLFIEATDTLTEYDETLNVIIHKDLWVNNILFRYDKEVPVNAVLIDFQCIRYGPPTFDLMQFIYFTTTREFRKNHEENILRHYFSIFWSNLDDASKERLKILKYDWESFLEWCERARMFGIFEAMVIYPFILMDPKAAERSFGNPETFQKHILEDRSSPVIAYARTCDIARERQLEVIEEFIERYAFRP